MPPPPPQQQQREAAALRAVAAAAAAAAEEEVEVEAELLRLLVLPLLPGLAVLARGERGGDGVQ